MFSTHITKHLRVIRNAWHFWCQCWVLCLRCKGLGLVVALLTP
ncbi:DUF3265 domain-containing protein [Vibrio antiquarius]|nr:DUF3265 domain-containing protein [Vibrio antiquarius]MCR9619400.1 DUF3265 domain-containing protein [Vibrio antiquarius]